MWRGHVDCFVVTMCNDLLRRARLAVSALVEDLFQSLDLGLFGHE